jgi:hypothetical protein
MAIVALVLGFSSRALVALVAAVAALVLGACNDSTSYEPVTVVGWPCATSRLVTPIAVTATWDGNTATVNYVGGADTAPAYMHQIMLEKDAAKSLRVRIGACRANADYVDCRAPAWIGGVQVVDVDTRLPQPKLVLGFPGEHPCVAD